MTYYGDAAQTSAGLGYGPWIIGGLIVLAFIGFLFWFFPWWNVWASQKSGEAALAEANREQRIQIARAQGRLEAAELNKQAAVIEAEAVAKQIEVIGKNLEHHDLYLRWQWIKMMEDRPENSVIYVPTEANLPILEAGLRVRPKEDE